MLTRRNRNSSISTQSARKRTKKTHGTQAPQRLGSKEFSPAVVESRNSPSPLLELYRSPEFQLKWDNQVAYHVSDNLLHLRLFRGMSQSEVAEVARTSQSAIARVESGEANVTLGTLERLVEALRGRFIVSIEPAEHPCPRLPAWWKQPWSFTSSSNLQFVGYAVSKDDQGDLIVAGWDSASARLPLAEAQAPSLELGQGMGMA
ncbi:MAG TPA: helix-turn-helix transcriptional regulator [Terriglobales bacterium]|jgi:transcriptional regulator with XRE-family HTH domain